MGGTTASTVLGGAGRYRIDGGTGAMTIFGAGDGDYLQAGNTGSNVITAGRGIEILAAGAGNATLIGTTDKADFSFQNIGTLAGAYVVEGFHKGDLMSFADEATATYALNHYSVNSGTNGTITLQHGTTIVLQGYTDTLGTLTGYAGYHGGMKTDLVT